jgi:hypothetical protein
LLLFSSMVVEYYKLSHLKMGFDLSLDPSLDVSFMRL